MAKRACSSLVSPLSRLWYSHRRIALVAGAVVLAAITAGAWWLSTHRGNTGPSEAVLEAGERDWRAFASQVSDMEDLAGEKVEDALGGRTVQWTGKLRSDLQASNAVDSWPDIAVEMSPNSVTLRDGKALAFDVILKATPEQWRRWAGLNAGARTVFRTKLDARSEGGFCRVYEDDGQKMLLLTSGAEIVGAPPAPRSPSEVKKPDMEELQGTWEIVSSESEGKKGRGQNFAMYDLPVDVGGRYTFRGHFMLPEGAKEVGQTSVEIRSGKMPKEVDWLLPPGEALRSFGVRANVRYSGIYQLDGDTLTWCYVIGGERPRPDGFKTSAGDGRSLWKLKRISSN